MREQHFIDFARGDFLAPTIDQLFEAPDERQIPVGVQVSLIACAEPVPENDAALASGLFS